MKERRVEFAMFAFGGYVRDQSRYSNHNERLYITWGLSLYITWVFSVASLPR